MTMECRANSASSLRISIRKLRCILTPHEKYVLALENDLAKARSMLRAFVDPWHGWLKLMDVKSVRNGFAWKVEKFLAKPMPVRK